MVDRDRGGEEGQTRKVSCALSVLSTPVVTASGWGRKRTKHKEDVFKVALEIISSKKFKKNLFSTQLTTV